MGGGIRGHQGEFRILKNGQIVNIVHITRVSDKMDSTMMRSKYVGNPIPAGDQAIEGWSGSMVVETVDDEVEQIIDAIVTSNLAGIGADDFAFVRTENYPDGSSSSYLYSDVQIGYSRENGGLDEKITKTLDWQASVRQRI